MRKISISAFELFRTLQQAKAVFRFQFIHAASSSEITKFESGVMQALGSTEEDDALQGKPVQASVFPAVWKLGDEMGNNLNERTTICKARVVVQQKSQQRAS
ncbi:hypothetical protein LTR49_027272 [Elasticomyces elasticus]|nr:hypothetical protein LTR49_027272 [Elasticomyces elasticus]